MNRAVFSICVIAVFWFSAATAQLQPKIAGASELVFDSRKGCDPSDIPDSAARAFRDASGTIHLFASFATNREMTGPDWSALKRDCRVVYRGTENPDPAEFNDRAWLSGFFVTNENTVYALVHNEYQGIRHSGKCPSGVHQRCWYNSITLAVSRDGGFTFQRPKNALVAVPRLPYTPDAPRRIGAANPTNIVKYGSNYYFMYVNDLPDQGGQICLARSNSVADPDSWRAWDGVGFNVALNTNPYKESPKTEAQPPCRHLHGLITGSVGSITRHETTGLFVLTQTAARVPGREPGIYFSLSPDLITWTRPALLWHVPTYNADCATPALYDYPSLIDPNSKSSNFETIGNTPALYVIRRAFKDCKGTMDRQLLRIPLRMDAQER